MNADPHMAAPGPEDEPDPDAGLFALLNDYWEALQRGASTDLDAWTTSHSEGRDKLPHLRLVSRLYDALQMVREDSCCEVSSMQASPGPVDQATRQFLEPGTLIDQCRIESLLGYGGMGEVYLAEHTVMGKKVAVKVLPASRVGDADAVRRFQQEIRVQARMNPHSNVAAAFHASEYQGRCYLVMEYVAGMNLREQVRQHGPLPWKQACALVRQIAVGLDYVHRHNIVHRDLKPSNLLLTPDGTVKILDLGLARHRPAEVLLADGSLTPDGAMLGTLDYLAPEQAQSAAQADARSDLYSLGCTFYYLLTGQAPFADRVGLEKVTAHARDPVPSLRQKRPNVPEAIEAIVEKLLAKKPEDRYTSAHDVIGELDTAAPAMPSRAGTQAPTQGPNALACPPEDRCTSAETFGKMPAIGLQKQAAPSEFIGGETVNFVPAPLSRKGWFRGRWLVAAVALSVLVGGMGYLASRRTANENLPLAIDGSIRLISWDGKASHRRYRQHDQQGGVPLKQGDLFRVEVNLNRPAYVYVILIEPAGRAIPLYPWKSGKWNKRLMDERGSNLLKLPEEPDPDGFSRGWRIPPWQPGMVTLVLLARATPLPCEVDLATILARIQPQQQGNFRAGAWIENGKAIREDVEQELVVLESETIKDPVLRTEALLKNELGKYFELRLPVSYPYEAR
jgi:tRNA A-37 threonylcarbamoyl transferase component Bud32